MPSPVFEMFETISLELKGKTRAVITSRAFSTTLMTDLQKRFKVMSHQAAMERAIAELKAHFERKNSVLPFSVDTSSWVYTSLDTDFIDFVALVSNFRGGKDKEARQFEISTCERLAKRLTGAIYRVGWPKMTSTRWTVIVSQLVALGFSKDVLEPEDKDGGLDILWFPPLGAIPVSPIGCFQCKNGSYSFDNAVKSCGKARRSMARHSHMRVPGAYLSLTVFNDYIDESLHRKIKGADFVPIGISDLAALIKAPPQVTIY